MKRKDKQDLSAKTADELMTLSKTLGEEIKKLKMDQLMGKVKNINEVRSKMKDRARMLTMITEKGGKGEHV